MSKKILNLLFILLISTSLFADAKDDLISKLTIQLQNSTELLQEQNNTIEKNNKLISSLQNRINADQLEIKGLRDIINGNISNNTNYYTFSILVNYNTNKSIGVNTIIGFRLPIIPVNLEASLGVNSDLLFDIGIGIGFEF